jgi:acetyl esterase/lipase
MKALPVAIGAAAVATATLALRRYLSARDAIAAVPSEFRSPLLPLLTGDTNERNYRRARLMMHVSTPTGAGVTVAKRTVAGRPVLVMTPARRGRAGLLYIHGGGMVVGSPQSEALGAAQLARELGVLVASPDYRLAPEHPFPAALDDCMATLYWMRDNADELGIDSERISVTGIALRAQALVYPMIDDRTVLRDHNGRGRFLWTPESNRFGWTAYLGRPPRLSDAPEYAAPARRENLSGLAPAWVGIGGLDLFYDESVDYAERLCAAGVECELVAVPGMYHGADGLARNAPAMRAFRRGALEFLRSHL